MTPEPNTPAPQTASSEAATNYNHQEIYEKEIVPKIMELQNRCNEAGLPLMLHCFYSKTDEGYGYGTVACKISRDFVPKEFLVYMLMGEKLGLIPPSKSSE